MKFLQGLRTVLTKADHVSLNPFQAVGGTVEASLGSGQSDFTEDELMINKIQCRVEQLNATLAMFYLVPAVFVMASLAGHDAKASSALASSIICMSDQGIPVTVVKTKTGKNVPIIYWKSTTFSGSGWSPERRCQEVSARFQKFHSSNKLEYITTGRMNGLPVICVANSDGGACAGLLYTLKPGQNATSTLTKLFNIQRKPGSAPLEETTARLYVNVDSIIQQKMDNRLNPSPMPQTPSTSKPGYPLF